MYIYADNAATTKLSDKAKNELINQINYNYGNASSLHSIGQKSAEILYDARKAIATLLGCNDKNIFFTSGGSESDNMAILSAVEHGKKKGKKHIITTKFEHHAVLHTVKKLEKQGYDVTYLDVYENGIVKAEDVKNAIRDDTALVTVMYANNEIGTIQPITEIGEICAEKKILFHTDAVQAVGHVQFNINDLKADYLSLSAHKFGGPKGVGVLYAKNRSLVYNLIEGGAQEYGKRAGTENVPSIASMAVALNESIENISTNYNKVLEMRERLIDGLLSIPHTVLNGDRVSRLPGNVNVCFEGIEGESLLLMLDCMGIAASSGSACTSGSLEPSHVLLAIGRPHEIAHGSLRLSINHENTMEEIERIISVTADVVEKLRSMSPVWDDLQKGRKIHVI